MNKNLFTGRLVKDPVVEIKGERSKLTFSIAVRRNYKNNDGEYDADFPLFIAWGNNADFLSKYAKKGDLIEVEAEYRTHSYDGNHYKWFNVRSVSIISHVAKPQSSDVPPPEQDDVPDEFNWEDVFEDKPL